MRKWFHILAGALLVIAGLILLWTPIPLGLPLLLIGLPVLMRFSPNARRWILRLTRRHPGLSRRIRRLAGRRERARPEASQNRC
jgi:hypothetical protein